MKKIKLSIIILFFSIQAVLAQRMEADKITGYWLNAEKDAKIQIYKYNSRYFGKIVWVKNMYEKDGVTIRTDLKNPDKEARSKSFINLVILTNLKYDDGEWIGGKIYDPKSGKTYSCTVNVNSGAIKIRGYIGVSMFGRTTVWEKAG